MTTQTHKWLPSEPTPAMLEAEQFASSLVYESHEVQAIEVYKAVWQAAPVAEQQQRESFTVTRHEVREAMMYCEISHCDYPDAYTFDILKRLGIGVDE
jgi:hypothetical protein